MGKECGEGKSDYIKKCGDIKKCGASPHLRQGGWLGIDVLVASFALNPRHRFLQMLCLMKEG
jgi:hypothetical protein